MYVNINPIALHYEVLGAGDPLILLGGLTANSREWLKIEKQLAKRFTVYKPENRGAGQTTGWSNEFTIEHMAHDIIAWLDALGIERAYMVGHSMGGAILQQLCITDSTRAKAAIIASSFASFPKAAQLYIENTASLLAANLPIELVLKTIATRLYGSEFLNDDIKMAAEFHRLLHDPAPQTPEGYWGQVKAIELFDSRKRLYHIQCPTLILNGTEDILTPTYLSEELHQGISGSTFLTIPQCGHMMPQEKPKELSHHILNFFS